MEPFEKKINKKILLVNIISFFFISAFLVCVFLIMFSKLPSPYSKTESVYWLYKNIFGPVHFNESNIKDIDSPYILNSKITPETVITFVGDFLPVKAEKLVVSEELKQYLKESDYFIGNFEGIITEKERVPSLWNFDMRYDKEVLNLFHKIFNPKKMALSVANNHAFDFGEKEFAESNKFLALSGIEIFGTEKEPYFDINDQIRVIGATRWLNKEGRKVVLLDQAGQYLKKGVFNILYLHYGFEFELSPRKSLVSQTEALLSKFDAVIGHHVHCPQQVTIEAIEGTNKLAAYSLGTFLGEVYEKKYQYGLVLKMFLGKDKEGKMGIAKIEHRLIKCSELLNGDFLVDFSNEPMGAFNR